MVPIPAFTTLLFRLFAGTTGGLLGMIFSLLVLLGSTSFNTEAESLAETSLTSSFSAVTILSMVFVGTMISNLLTTVLLGVFEKEKYHRIRSTSFQVFVFTFVLFLFFLPAYTIAGDQALAVASKHFLLSALLSVLICEIMSDWRYSFTGLLGTLFSGSGIMGIFLLLDRVEFNQSILLIFALPLIWICIILGVFLAEVLHGVLYKIYGIAPLSPEQKQ